MKRLRCRLFFSIRSAGMILLAALVSAAMLPTGACAGAYTYNSGSSQRTVNAGILVLSPNEIGSAVDNPDPYAFYVLSQRPDVTPYGWDIVNPLAPKNVTADILSRWTNRDGTNLYTIAESITPKMGAYWEVQLSRVTPDDLQQYDVLLLNVQGGHVRFTPADSEKLRRFVDGGGTLWVEGGVGGVIGDTAGANGLFFDTISLVTATVTSTSPRTTAVPNPTPHTILTAPYSLQTQELDLLTGSGVGIGLSGNAGSILTPVLNLTGGGTVVAAGSYGAGAIVATTNNTAYIANLITTHSTFDQNIQGTAAIPAYTLTSALKLMANIIAWNGGSPAEHRSGHQDGSTFSAFPSPARNWNRQYTNGSGVATTPAIYGGAAFAVDTAGVLHAFNLNPTVSTLVSYSRVWKVNVGANASSPTVAIDPLTDRAIVLVETSDGTIKKFDAAGGGAATVGTAGTSAFFGPAPAPVVYNGTVYGIQSTPATGAGLSAYNLSTGDNATYVLSPNGVAATGGLSVGIVPSDVPVSGTAPAANDILALIPTTQYLYSVLLGVRGESLRSTATVTPTIANYLTKLLGQSKFTATSNLRGYGLDADGFIAADPTVTASSTNNSFTVNSSTALSSPLPSIFADYDTDLKPTQSGTDLTRTQVGLTSLTATQSGISGTVSSAAFDRFGNACYITNEGAHSSLVSFHDASMPINIKLNWRFRLPIKTGTVSNPGDGSVIDADGVDYTDLTDFVFQGAPVVDERGYVYALAAKSGRVAVVCINGLQTVTTEAFNISLNNDVTLSQPIPAVGATSQSTNEFDEQITDLRGQFDQGSVGAPLKIKSFGRTGGNISASTRALYPVMCEPESFAFSLTSQAVPYTELKLHSNLVWFTVLPPSVKAGSGGLTKAGGSLFFIDDLGHLISVVADPVSAGIPIVLKRVDSTPTAGSAPPMVSDYGDTGTGSGGAIAAGGGALVVNGSPNSLGVAGTAGYANRVTVVAEGSRVMELSADGNATWVVDSTTGAAPNTALALSGVTAAPSLELNRPNSVAELAANDYLVADTGNNRCVRFTRTGNVIWELNRVNDEYNINGGDDITAARFGKTSSTTLLAPGEPDTLNQPTSVQIRTEYAQINGTTYTPNGPNPNYTIVHYLISDTGNYRVLEVVDVFDGNGNIVGTPHNLVWVSHTHDKQKRDYRYQSASYYTDSTGKMYVAALVTNKRVTLQPNSTTLAPGNQEGPGGSIVLLNMTYNPAANSSDGNIAEASSQFSAYLTGSPTTGYAFDLNSATNPPTGTPPSKINIRNPRYLKVYLRDTALNSPHYFLLADDNGVFDLDDTLTAKWGFTQNDYWGLTNPIDNSGTLVPRGGSTSVTPPRPALPFIPFSIQRTGTDQVGLIYFGRYLVTNGYSQGEASAAGGFGGEVLELYVSGSPGSFGTQASGAHTLSRPTNTGPLIQPTFAYRAP